MNSININVPYLPEEILLKIFNIIAKKNHNNLYNILTVSKRWNKLSSFVLYNNIYFNKYSQRVNFLRGLLSNNDEQFNRKKENELDISLYEKEFNSYLNVKINPIPEKYINSIKKISFCYSPDDNDNDKSDSDDENSNLNENDIYMKRRLNWNQRCINASLNIISIYCSQLVYLNISGCQFFDYIFVELLDKCNNLKYLDISYSSVKQVGLIGIIECVSKEKNPLQLQEINFSGIFRFWRFSNILYKFFPNLVQNAKSLQKIVLLNCPDISMEIIDECKNLRNSINIVYENKTRINEMYIKSNNTNISRKDSSMTLGANDNIYI